MKGIVIYQSKYSATSQYAQWLAEALDLPFVNSKSVTPAMIVGNDLIIVGSSVYILPCGHKYLEYFRSRWYLTKVLLIAFLTNV